MYYVEYYRKEASYVILLVLKLSLTSVLMQRILRAGGGGELLIIPSLIHVFTKYLFRISGNFRIFINPLMASSRTTMNFLEEIEEKSPL